MKLEMHSWNASPFFSRVFSIIFLASIVGGSLAHGAEADYFTERADFPRREVSLRLDQLMSSALARVVELIPRELNGRCDRRYLIAGLTKIPYKALYFVCREGGWRRNEARPFTVADYIQPGCYEALNCNSYREEWKTLVMNPIQESGYHCPVQPKHCDFLRKRYSGERASLISPEYLDPYSQQKIPTS